MCIYQKQADIPLHFQTQHILDTQKYLLSHYLWCCSEDKNIITPNKTFATFSLLGANLIIE